MDFVKTVLLVLVLIALQFGNISTNPTGATNTEGAISENASDFEDNCIKLLPHCTDTGGKCKKAGTGLICECPDGKTSDMKFMYCLETCEGKCGLDKDETENDNVKCEKVQDSVTCSCKNTELAFHAKTKKCMVLETCEEKCGLDKDKTENGYVQCEKVQEIVTCFCKNSELEFDASSKKCIAFLETCEGKCGLEKDRTEDDNVKCEKVRGSVTCSCKNIELAFNVNTRKCTADKCKEKCGIGETVKCYGDPFGENGVSCKCKDEKMMFAPKEKTCKLNKCKDKCGAAEGEVKCEGDPLGDAEVGCKCKDEKLTFVAEEKACRRQKALTLSAIVGIVVCVIAAVVIAVLLFVHFNKSSKNAGYYESDAETMAFESALYNATYESVEMRKTQERRNIP